MVDDSIRKATLADQTCAAALKMNSKDANSENSFLKIELRVGEEKLQLALPTRADVDLDSSARQT